MRHLRKQIVVLTTLLCVLCMSGNALASTIKLPTGIKVVEEEAFDGSGITCVEIPENTERIESKAFTNNASLTDVYLPKSDVEIAPDAFDQSTRLTFHAFLGTENANWVTDHGYKIEYISAGGEEPSGDARHQVSALIAAEGTSALQDNKYGTGRLIIKLNSGSVLPDLDQYNPKQTIAMGNNLYVIQFHNYNDARDCALTLEAWSGCKYVEADYFLSSADTEASSNGLRSRALLSNGAYNATDPMGFTAYTNSLPDTVGNVTVAVIDNGVTASQVDCTVSSKSYDFVTDQYTLSGNQHGTTVATHLCNSFGRLKNHLTIISYNVENHSNGKISYLMMGLAILQAKDDGANFINISIAGESSYSDEQDNEFLRECISYFGASKIVAAGGNYASSVNNFIPAKYCASVTGVKLSSDGTSLLRAGTATGANYGGYSNFTSYAAPMVTAAFALVWLDPDQTHMLSDTLEPVVGDNAKMPILSRLAIKSVNEIIINDGEPVESVFEVGDRASIDYEINPTDATDPQVNVAIEPSDGSVIEIIKHESSRVRFRAVSPGTATMTFTSNDGNAPPVVVPITVIQPVTSVSISGNTGEQLMKDETLSLSATVLPENASDKGITWTSSNNTIATVSSEGAVTQKGSGTVTITATSTSYPSISDSVVIEVTSTPRVQGVTVSPTGGIYTLYVGKTAGTVQMNAAVFPSNADQSVTWSVDNSNIATISSTGLLTAKADGTVSVIATSVSSGAKGYCVMTVEQLPTSISISGDSSVVKDSTITLTATVSPSNARNKEVTWSSSDTNVAAVSSSGVVTGKGAGSAVIFATSKADGTVTGQKTVSVVILPSSVAISNPSSTVMDIGGRLTLSATVSPSNATNKTLSWSTSDSSVATVSDGVVTAKAAGSVTITATTVNSKTSSITLTVRQPYTLSFNANGGSCGTSSITVYSGYAIGNVLPTPTRDYYTFLGWFTAASGGTKLTSSWSATCSTTYTVYAHWSENAWSDWVDPSQVPSSGVRTESKTQYQYRDLTYSSWSAWSAWSKTSQTIDDATLKEQQTATIYPWYYYTCPNCGYHNKLTKTSCSSCKKGGSSTSYAWHGPIWTTKKWTVSSRTEGAKVNYTETEYGYGLLWSYSTNQGTGVTDSATGYRYRTRTSSWGSWTSWSDTAVSSSSTRQVNTRTLKRYQYK